MSGKIERRGRSQERRQRAPGRVERSRVLTSTGTTPAVPNPKSCWPHGDLLPPPAVHTSGTDPRGETRTRGRISPQPQKDQKWEVSCEPTLKSQHKGHLHCPPPGNCPNRQRREITTNPKLLRRYILTSLSIDFSLFISKLG